MHKLFGAIAAFLLGVSCGTPSSSPTSAPSPRPEGGARTGVVVCGRDGTEIRTQRVVARRDGVHVRFQNRSGAFEFYMRSADDPDDNHGGTLRGPSVKDVASHAPGPMWVACRHKGEDHLPFYEDDPRYARFEIVDPKGHWISLEPDCDAVETVSNERIEDAETFADVETWIRDRFDVEEGERVRPGYPETQWKGTPWVLRHEERTLVYFSAFEDDAGWVVARAEGCRDS